MNTQYTHPAGPITAAQRRELDALDLADETQAIIEEAEQFLEAMAELEIPCEIMSEDDGDIDWNKYEDYYGC